MDTFTIYLMELFRDRESEHEVQVPQSPTFCVEKIIDSSVSVFFLSLIETQSTYGPTIAAIAQGSFAWGQIWRRD